jgi:CheY-like chemotaxis protein/transcriptional regulator with XRE-family HTH domain
VAREPTFPASRELFRLARAVADAANPREKISDAELGRMIGLESARTSRWKHGQIAVNDAARLLALAQSLDLDVSILSPVAAGYLSSDEALEIIGSERRMLRHYGEQLLLPADKQVVTLTVGDGSRARVTRRSAGKYDRSFRRGGAGGLKGKNQDIPVLLVDDDESTLEMFGNLTGPGTGIAGAVARSGPEALIAAGQLRPRTVVFDLFIGGIDGFAAVRSLSSHKATGGTEVVATSLSLTPDIVRSAKGSGATDVLQRPLRARPLGKLLRDLRRGR